MKPAPRDHSSRIQIAVINQDPLRFVGLRSILESEPDFQVHPQELRSFQDHPTRYRVVLLGVQPNSALFDLVAKLRTTSPSTRIILTGGPQKDELILRALASGVSGYLDETATAEAYKGAIRAVAGGSMWLPRRVMARFIERVTANPRSSLTENSGPLSERELQVLELLVNGLTNREIAGELGIEERTVKAHVSKLMHKTGAPNRITLSVYALRNSLLDTE
jgi:DNA-binding NarL/FixJ family response regulator